MAEKKTLLNHIIPATRWLQRMKSSTIVRMK